ncbi:hypothetical protein DFH07DRAFT_1065295 [Mycena maculata]|uniref:MYND-type domain-containing protein n=1 Tax=Mycena maculata TaxID=230809 RepID=A0AAD7I4B7_9AGAR|nr:hypothetical protein DFH07DRAFT_1065295 [Mycena maculata]
MSQNNEATPILIHAIHPDNAANFQALAGTSPTNIRKTRNALKTMCTNCFKNEPGLKLSRCGKCKGVWYCSHECQKNHWPVHKQVCTNVDGSGIQRLVQNLYSNPLLAQHLQACFILEFDLLHRPQLDAPFMARVDIGIEPADISEFFNIFIGKPLPSGKIKGMLQVNKFTPVPPEAMADLTQTRKEIWRAARESADTMGYRGRDSVGLVEFGNGESPMTITCPMHIQRSVMDLVRESPPWVMKSAITGEVTEAAFNIENCMQFINTHIRADKNDQLLLRTDMRPSDIQFLADCWPMGRIQHPKKIMVDTA